MAYSITVSQTKQILLIINVNTWEHNPVTIDAKSKGAILNLFVKTGKHTDTIVWSINATTTGSDLVSYRYQSEANHLDIIVWSINATSVFEVYVLQNNVNRHNYVI